MEGKKRAVAACCLLLTVLLSGQQQQVAAMSKFCRCYNKCYADCRKYSGPSPCSSECLQDCVNGQPLPSRPASLANCNYACLVRLCGVMDTAMAAPGDAEACVADCTKKLGAFAPRAAKIN